MVAITPAITQVDSPRPYFHFHHHDCINFQKHVLGWNIPSNLGIPWRIGVPCGRKYKRRFWLAHNICCLLTQKSPKQEFSCKLRKSSTKNYSITTKISSYFIIMWFDICSKNDKNDFLKFKVQRSWEELQDYHHGREIWATSWNLVRRSELCPN